MILDNWFSSVQIVVMITNGPSDDQIDAAARAVADNGISLFAVGECGRWFCEFLQHPHCSGPSHFIRALPAYLQCLQSEIHVIHLNSLDSVWVFASVWEILVVWVRPCTVYVCANITTTKYVFSSYTVYIKVDFLILCCLSKASLSYGTPFPPLMNTHRCLPTSVLTHILPSFSYTPTNTRTHEHTSPQLTPLSWERCNNYCSLADGVLIAAIFH